MIPQHEIDRVLDLDIHTVIEKYIHLKRDGHNYKGCCPFHNEKTPSFLVSDVKGIYKCFGCGKGGNAINFVMELQTLSFIEALKEIAKQAGMTLQEEKQTEEDQQRTSLKETTRACLQVAERFFQEQLFEEKNKEALNYALSRWDEKTIHQFKIGFSPDGFQNFRSYGKANGLNDEDMFSAGLLRKKDNNDHYFDYFINRLVFPIYDKVGNIIAFIGRDMSGNIAMPKYINSPETLIFKKSTTLFGLHIARKTAKESGNINLVEGNPDVVRLQSNGITNTVATLGTALTNEHIEQISKFCKSITIIGDTDEAGKKAVSESAKKILENGLFCYIINLPATGEKADPDSFFKDEKQFVDYEKDNKTDFIIYYAEKLLKEAGNDAAKRGSTISEVVKLLMNFSDTTIINQYAEMLGNKLKPKKQWTDAVKLALKERVVNGDAEEGETSPLINRVENFISKHYEIRYNDISNQFQAKEIDKEETIFELLNENNILRNLRKHHFNYSAANLIELLKSDFVEHFNPIIEYFEKLPRWDGKTKHIQNLAKYIILEDEADRDRFERMFRKMFIRSIACSFEIAFNKHAFILVHERQSSGKTTFLRWLVPQTLKDYYTEHLSLDKDGMIALTENFIINMDELSTLSKFEINALKSLLSKDKVKVRIPYERRPAILQRRCNFIGSTNRLEFLNDETGNVRWICFHIKNINWKYMQEISIDDVWGEAFYAFKHTQEDFQLNADEIQENEMANIKFITRTPELEILQRWFIPSMDGEPGAEFLTATEIMKKMIMKSDNSAKIKVENIGRALTMLKFNKESQRVDRFEHPIKGYWIREISTIEEEKRKEDNRTYPQLDFQYQNETENSLT
jgi:DNA primase catalytic core